MPRKYWMRMLIYKFYKHSIDKKYLGNLNDNV